MAWESVTPQRGRRISARVRVTAAWAAPNGTRKTGTLRVTLGNEVAAQLGWVAKERVSMDMDKAAGLVRLTRCITEGWSLNGKKQHQLLELVLRLDYLQSEPRTATPIEHEIVGGAIILHLPAWARWKEAAPAAATSFHAVKEAPARPARVSIVDRVPDQAEAARRAARFQ